MLIPATPQDLKLVTQLVKEYYAYDHIPYRKAVGVALEKLLKNPEWGTVWIFSAPGEAKSVAGYITLTYAYDIEFGGRFGIVTDFYLRSDFRGKGYGKKMIQAVSVHCRKNKVKMIELHVEIKNKKAQAFYQKMGFRPLPRIPHNKKI